MVITVVCRSRQDLNPFCRGLLGPCTSMSHEEISKMTERVKEDQGGQDPFLLTLAEYKRKGRRVIRVWTNSFEFNI